MFQPMQTKPYYGEALPVTCNNFVFLLIQICHGIIGFLGKANFRLP